MHEGIGGNALAGFLVVTLGAALGCGDSSSGHNRGSQCTQVLQVACNRLGGTCMLFPANQISDCVQAGVGSCCAGNCGASVISTAGGHRRLRDRYQRRHLRVARRDQRWDASRELRGRREIGARLDAVRPAIRDTLPRRAHRRHRRPVAAPSYPRRPPIGRDSRCLRCSSTQPISIGEMPERDSSGSSWAGASSFVTHADLLRRSLSSSPKRVILSHSSRVAAVPRGDTPATRLNCEGRSKR